MSARMFQRALRNNEAKSPVDTVNSDQNRSDSEEDHARESVSNRFDLLGLQDDAEDDEGEDVERHSDQQSAAGSASTSAPVPSKAKRKKNKGKKKGKQQGSSEERQVDEDESVDQLLERLVVRNGESSSSVVGQDVREFPNVLAVDTKHLRAEDELRRIFGSKVINSVENGVDGSGFSRRRQAASRRTGRGMPLRKSLLVVPMEHWGDWARCDGGISMECTEVKDGLQFYRYKYSPSYLEVQKKFESCVASHDPNTIVMLLRQHPYHVDSLLALAEVYKHMGEFQHAADLLEQSLYALECSWHPWFNPALGICRLDFSCDTNKSLFLALFRHMQHLGKRGCHRTALEVCKFLLSLDPSDPLGSLFCIDYFALRAEQYEWLEDFVERYEKDKSLSLLPNFSYSLAVACFHLEERSSERSNGSGGNSKQAKGSRINKISSDNLLQQALMIHPCVVKKIIDKAPIKEDVGWTKILTHPHFLNATGGGPTLEHLINIYVERNYLIWRAPELQAWLKEAAAAVTRMADKSQDTKSSSEMANWQCVRTEVFHSNDNEYRHLHVSEFSDSTSTLPPEEVPQLGFPRGFAPRVEFQGADVLADDVARDNEILQIHQTVQQAASQGRNALLVFLHSLVPRVEYGGEVPVEDAPVLLEEGSEGDTGGDDRDC